MEITAQAKYIHLSPRKVRLVAQAVKKLSPTAALEQLALMPKRAGKPIAVVLQSAVANALNNAKLKLDVITIKEIIVNGGPALKRFQPVSRGRAHSYKKRMSHITVVLTDNQSQMSNVKSQIVEAKEEKEIKVAKGEKHGTKS